MGPPPWWQERPLSRQIRQPPGPGAQGMGKFFPDFGAKPVKLFRVLLLCPTVGFGVNGFFQFFHGLYQNSPGASQSLATHSASVPQWGGQVRFLSQALH